MDFNNVIRTLYRDFETGNMILLLGEDFQAESEARIYSMRWNCVLTTSRDPSLASLFLADESREVNDLDLEQVNSLTNEELMTRSSLKIVRLQGVDQEDRSVDLNDLLLKRKQRELLKRVGRLLCTNLGHLIILGWPKADTSGLSDTLLDVGMESPARSLLAFGVEEESTLSPILHALTESSKKPDVFPERLSDAIDEYADEEDERDHGVAPTGRNQFTRTVFARGEALHISTLEFSKCAPFAMPLTEEDVMMPVVYGRVDRREHLYFFMRDSVSGPVWEGYNPKNEFYVKREVEDKLFALTKRVLERADNNDEDDIAVQPILLMGDPGSSKSITLAAVAYRIFCEAQYPVVYLTNSSLRFRDVGKSGIFYHFNEMLKRLELLGNDAPYMLSARPVLIVWDGSVSDVKSRVGELWDELKNHGRRAVLLCSAYNQKGQMTFAKREKDGQEFFVSRERSPEDDKKARNDERMQRTDYYMLESTRTLSKQEEVKLEQLCQDVAQIDHKRWKETENGENLFLRLFDDLEWMRGSLSGIVRQEYASFMEGSTAPASLSLTTQKTAMALAFERAGLAEDAAANQRIVLLDWEGLSICVALFTRFRVELPISAAMTVLCGSEGLDNDILDRILTLPWLRYCSADNDPDSCNYVLLYRTVREAEILLDNISVERQRDCILKLMDQAGAYYKKTLLVDTVTLKAIHQLFIKIGPNSREECFRGSPIQQEWQKKAYEELLDALKALRESGLYQLYLINDEVTFTREIYQNKTESIEECMVALERLVQAQQLAQDTVSGLESERVLSRSDRFIASNLNNEVVHCSGAAWNCYQSCKKLAKAENRDVEIVPPRFVCFEDLWANLWKAIQSDRENSFNYIAALRLFNDDFERRYRKDSSEINLHQLRDNVVQIREMIDGLNTDEFLSPTQIFTTEQKAEFDKKVAQFEANVDRLASGEQISIERVTDAQNGSDSGFLSYFKERTEMEHNPSAVLFVVQTELTRAGIRFNELLNVPQVEKCRQVFNFLEKYNGAKYGNMIQAIPAGASMQLRLFWAIVTSGLPMIPKRIYCPAPPLSQEDWHRLIGYCDGIFALMGNSDARRNDPKVSYIKALSLAEIGEYQKAAKEVEQVNRSLFHATQRGNARRNAYYVISDPSDGGGTVSRKFRGGRVSEISPEGTGYAQLREFKNLSLDHEGVHFHYRNLGMDTIPVKGRLIPEAELAISFAGFTLHAEKSKGGNGQ